MIIDSSAIVAVLRNEAEAPQILAVLAKEMGRAQLSAPTYVELGIVVDRANDPILSLNLDEFLRDFRIEISAFDALQATQARAAYRVFGKGMGHPAQLNFGDCFTYALAKVSGMPLLCTGNDFRHTDLRLVDY